MDPILGHSAATFQSWIDWLASVMAWATHYDASLNTSRPPTSLVYCSASKTPRINLKQLGCARLASRGILERKVITICCGCRADILQSHSQPARGLRRKRLGVCDGCELPTPIPGGIHPPAEPPKGTETAASLSFRPHLPRHPIAQASARSSARGNPRTRAVIVPRAYWKGGENRQGKEGTFTSGI